MEAILSFSSFRVIDLAFNFSSINSCWGTFGGTSSATPLVAGIVAQILGVRPDLTHRDVQHIIRQTADRNDAVSPQWFQNAVGKHHSYTKT
jgi:subtilisin family serine protease